MPEVIETELPGFGVRYEFTTDRGRQVGVLVHRSGRRDLLVYDERDPDTCSETVRLDPESSQLLAELLGGSKVTERLGAMRQEIEGLAIDWIPLDQASAGVGSTIGELQIRTKTGVSVVAVVHGDDATPAPEPDYTLRAEDVVVAVGTTGGIEQVRDLLSTGSGS